MKVYLATAITRGRREYVDAVKKIRDVLKDAGVEVLNERVSDPNFPSPETDRAQTMQEGRDCLEQADALVAEATISSTGVGCELTWMQIRNKPVLLLYDAHFGFRISDWVTLNPHPSVQARPYRDHAEMQQLTKEFVGSLSEARS